MSVAETRSILTLLRWLGPWAGPLSVPAPVTRRTVVIAEGHTAWLYGPRGRAPHRSYIVAPGLHYAGPSEPRIQRFCSILAAAGFEVLAPFLPDFLRMRVTPALITDFEDAFVWLRDRSPTPPGVFSISFGSLPVLRLAGHPEHAEAISHAICFGGYGDFGAALEFCLTGTVDGARLLGRDPLNQPAAFLNLLDYMDGVPADRESLTAGWRRYLRATWGRPEMKADGAWQRVAERIADDLPTAVRELFLIGVGVLPGGIERCRPALARMGDQAAFVDPRPHLAGVRRPVTLVHGRDDDVIPYTQAPDLAAAFPPRADVRVLLTGLYDHSRPSARVRDLLGEGAQMVEILRAIALGHRAPQSAPGRS